MTVSFSSDTNECGIRYFMFSSDNEFLALQTLISNIISSLRILKLDGDGKRNGSSR